MFHNAIIPGSLLLSSGQDPPVQEVEYEPRPGQFDPPFTGEGLLHGLDMVL